MAEINKETSLFGPHDENDLRFSGRLHLHCETGDLTISGSKTTDSGDYHLHMSNNAYTLRGQSLRIMSVTNELGSLSKRHRSCPLHLPCLGTLDLPIRQTIRPRASPQDDAMPLVEWAHSLSGQCTPCAS